MLRARTLACEAVVLAFAVGVLTSPSESQGAGVGFVFDLATMTFDYKVTDPGAGSGAKIGELVVGDSSVYGSWLSSQKLDLGPNGVVGGDDTILDYANIIDTDLYESALHADVIKLGANSYRIEGTIRIADTGTTLANPKYAGAFTSASVMLDGGTVGRNLFFVGGVAPVAGADAILCPVAAGWSFDGLSADTPASPDEDGIRGTMGLSSGRSAYDEGALNGGVFVGFSPMTLDSFFGTDRYYTSITMQATAVPEPCTAGIGLLCLGWLVGRRR